jgi:hypothetical protein
LKRNPGEKKEWDDSMKWMKVRRNRKERSEGGRKEEGNCERTENEVVEKERKIDYPPPHET